MRYAKSRSFILPVFASLAALAGFVPVVRACFLEEVNYNEGWNIFNAQTVSRGGLLYPVRYGWTTVNYPILSFWLMAQLHRVTHDYLFTARALSIAGLLVSAAMVGVIVRALGASRWAAWFAGLFCWTAFCTTAPLYVGADDPQLLSQAVLMTALAVYVRGGRSVGRVTGAALLFALGLLVKHSQVDLPLAVFLDLLFVSWPLAIWFGLCLVGVASVGGWLSMRLGGPFFVAELLMPRSYSWARAGLHVLDALGPLLPVLAAAGYLAWRVRKEPQRRILLILLAVSLVVGGYFSGGAGVSVNAIFSVLLALSLLVGVFVDDVGRADWPRGIRRYASYAPWFCGCWLLTPLARYAEWDAVGQIREVRVAHRRFVEDVAVLRSVPGPALCESLLECYEAGKPFIYDPFNATRLIELGKLSPDQMVRELRDGSIGAVQAYGPLAQAGEQQRQRFSPVIRSAVAQWYRPVHSIGPDPALAWGSADGSVIYVPRPEKQVQGVKPAIRP